MVFGVLEFVDLVVWVSVRFCDFCLLLGWMCGLRYLVLLVGFGMFCGFWGFAVFLGFSGLIAACWYFGGLAIFVVFGDFGYLNLVWMFDSVLCNFKVLVDGGCSFGGFDRARLF